MHEILEEWTDEGWKKELDESPWIKNRVKDRYHINTVAAVGDDYGFKTTTLTDESAEFRKRWATRFPRLNWIEKPVLQFVAITNMGESAMNLAEGVGSVADNGLAKITNMYGHHLRPTCASLPVVGITEQAE